MSLNLRILMLLHRKYHPSVSFEMQSGRFTLLVITDSEGVPIRVRISSQTGNGQWYNRNLIPGTAVEEPRYTWKPETP